MRIKFKRNCLSYVVSVTVLSFLVTLYVIGLRQNKQIGTNFNLKPIRFKVRRDVHGSNKESLSANVVRSQRGNKSTWGHDTGKNGVVLDRSVPSSTSDTLNDTTEKSVNIYIVEEHHEVIPYWFGAVRRGIIPKTGNTIIHIDGHSDLAQPRYIPEYPFFRWPSDRQLKYLMQENDVFVQASAMAGMIDRYIWIWPDWDHSNHENKYVLNTLGMGWAYVTKGKHKTKEKTFCMCMSFGTNRQCVSSANAEKETNQADDNGYPINYKNCKIRKNLIVEEVHETKVLSFLSKSDWLANNENIMLDIDEDYFGCAYAIDPLLKANISYAKINSLDETISTQLCPLSTAQEKESDNFLMDLIATVRVQRACKIDPTLLNSTKCQKISKLDILNKFATLFNAKVSEKSINLCDNISGVHRFIQNILYQLGRLRIKQLRALQQTGFCSRTSPKTFKREDYDGFSICYGANTPEHTRVLEHVPTRNEILIRTEILQTILKKLNHYSPKIVTVCRSVRDGYTPRTHFELIEKSVLSTLNRTLDKTFTIHYDRDLIGGKPGWPSRHKA